MKIKSDFITNSSSSSFIVGFESIPETMEDVLKALFPETDKRKFYFHPYDEEVYTKEQVATTVFEDIAPQVPDDRERCEKEFISNYGGADYKDFQIPEHGWKIDWDAYRAESKKQGKIAWQEFLDTCDDNFHFYLFEYGDNNGQYFSALEHGDLFRNLPHIRISKH